MEVALMLKLNLGHYKNGD